MDDVKNCADLLNEALEGKKNKEETVYNVIVNNPLAKRLEIAEEYNKTYGKELYEEMKSKLSGNFKEVAIHLFLPPVRFYAKMLKKALKGMTKDENSIFEIFTTFTSEDIQKLCIAYNMETKKDLNEDIAKAFSGVMLKNVVNLMTVPRKVGGEVDKAACEKKCDELIKAGEANWVTDENLFKDIFICSSSEELVMICRYYFAKTQKNLFDVVEKNVSGKAKVLLKELLYNNICPYDLYAEKVYLAIKGIGTNTNLLNRVLVERADIDMKEIRQIYETKYKKTVKDDIMGDTSGMYQKLCLFLAGIEK